MKFLPLAAIAALVAVAIFCLVPPATAQTQAKASCGLSKVNGFYLQPITRLKRVSCREAKRVAKGALKRFDEAGLFCNGRVSYDGWSVTNPYYPGLAGNFVKSTGGKPRRFHISSQGAC